MTPQDKTTRNEVTRDRRAIEGRNILKMIEGVSPDDTATLDEIDARFWCFLNGSVFKAFEGNWIRFCDGFKTNITPLRYTRSRDALKSIRPDGCLIKISIAGESTATLTLGKSFICKAKNMPTEELAELHAIIQTYIWEAENG